ncbi:hypothetical protein EJ05DRAFT_455797 [Pseudovirgaria hyperparasitica]|uniref:ABC transporter domain-containing protein n=1 Tax=Pseudovirgaria hyperparasitica TaxID=470096 RepID=A0A6A6VYW7_9PEZI|nr:uncharacterized protein EJ05DRAFT_455797 [Pseudovirgaria hyperparasitica]KAF2755069.1 hypothetical protein EJ05DRAFT_455797 [Pseudovirgaria hyperparasitica]
MYGSQWSTLVLLPALFARTVRSQHIRSNFTARDLIPNPFAIRDDRPDNCPPCFNCNLDDFVCHQFADCSQANGRCVCPPGFGGEDCSQPACGSLADGPDRAPRQGDHCGCTEGWEGINCNLCTTNDACRAFVPTEDGDGAVCYKDGGLVKENYQLCDITNNKIVEMLKEKKPQATFSCNAETEECNFQFWVDERESFYCGLDSCTAARDMEENRNITKYNCDHIQCRCIPGRMLCGEENSIDIGDFLREEIKGPAAFTSIKTEGGSDNDGSVFTEPAMDNLIASIFGDKSIFLSCRSSECMYKTEVPGYEKPVKKINTPLIAGVIAGCALFVVAVILGVWFIARRTASRKGGYIHLSDEDEDESAKLLADHQPAALYFENVGYNLNGKQILSGVAGAVHPGELMAIMGASGAGKTTFLDILARKNKRGSVEGHFYLNGENVLDEEFRNVIGFVDQEDTLLPTLTVHETIWNSAMLRLPREMSSMSKAQKVEDVEKQLGIYHIRHQLIGSEEGSNRGISGGEKRRVGIACELVTSPSILFLDEPTSGLDAYNAYNVVECLVSLVKNYNRTVVFTIHQPRSNIVALFDQLVLLAKGRAVYSGPFSSCQAYFDSIGYPCPPGFNIADYLVDLTMHAGAAHSSIDENSSLFDNVGLRTSASSAIGVKSVPSVSNVSVGPDTMGSPGSSLRVQGKRRTSIRQQQERDLFTRKKSNTGGDGTTTPKTDDEVIPDNTQQWLRMSRQQGNPPPQILEDPDHLLPPANGGTGTNLDALITSYATSDVAVSLQDDIRRAVTSANEANGTPNGDGQVNGASTGKIRGYRKVGIPRQFVILSVRTWRNLYRNPMLMLTHYAIAIVLGVAIGYLFFGLTDDIKGFQNRLGLFFFILALFGFSTLTSLTVFAPERLIFVRERAKGYYHPLSYFLAKTVFDIVPLRIIPPIILGIIIYPMTGLLPHWGNFLKFMLFLVLFNLAAAGICLFIGICCRNSGVANLIALLTMLISLLFSGFLLNHETIPLTATWLQTLSIFHYAYEGLLVNEVRTLSLVDHKYGLDIEVPGASLLSSFGFQVLDLWKDAIGLGVFAAAFMVLSYLAMHVLLIERR